MHPNVYQVSAFSSVPLAVSVGLALGLITLALTILSWLHDLARARPRRRDPASRYLAAQAGLLRALGVGGPTAVAAVVATRVALGFGVLVGLMARLDLGLPLAGFGAILAYWSAGAALGAHEWRIRRRRAESSLELGKRLARLALVGRPLRSALPEAAASVNDRAVREMAVRLSQAHAVGGLGRTLIAGARELDDPVFAALGECVARSEVEGGDLASSLGAGLPGLRRRLREMEAVHFAARRVRGVLVAVPVIFLLPILGGRLDPSHLTGYGYDYLRPEAVFFEAGMIVLFGLGYAALGQVVNALGLGGVELAAL